MAKICAKCHFVFEKSGEACMCLPEGKTCNDCHHYPRCKMLGVIRQEPQRMCDWWPIRFVQAQQCRVCGCSQYNACPDRCWWVEKDLCSSCAGKMEIKKAMDDIKKWFDTLPIEEVEEHIKCPVVISHAYIYSGRTPPPEDDLKAFFKDYLAKRKCKEGKEANAHGQDSHESKAST